MLPSGFKRIRYYGLMAPCAKTKRLAKARLLLAMPAANAQAQEDAEAFMKRVGKIEINTCALPRPLARGGAARGGRGSAAGVAGADDAV